MRAAAFRFDLEGAQLFAAALGEAELARIESIWSHDDQPGERLYNIDAIADLIRFDGLIGRIAVGLQGPASRPVRALLFDKRADLNWALGLHQDRTIAVQERHKADGYGPWSIKAGQLHVQPPAEVIAAMLTLRIHLDEVDADTAPLTIIPGSHRLGRLSERRIAELAKARGTYDCHARRGDVWAYATAIVHGSGPVRVQGRRRRVLQIDYAAEELPHGLEWAMRV